MGGVNLLRLLKHRDASSVCVLAPIKTIKTEAHCHNLFPD